MSKVTRISDRVSALEAARRKGGAYRMSKAERDMLVAKAIADPANMALALAAVPERDMHRRAAVEAAMRADQ